MGPSPGRSCRRGRRGSWASRRSSGGRTACGPTAPAGSRRSWRSRRLVRRLERAGHEVFLFDRLRRELGVDAGRAQEHKPLNVRLLRSVHHVQLHAQVVREELGRVLVVREDPAHAGRGQDQVAGTHLAQQVERRLAVAQVDLARTCARRGSCSRRPRGAARWRSRRGRGDRRRRSSPTCRCSCTSPLSSRRRAVARVATPHRRPTAAAHATGMLQTGLIGRSQPGRCRALTSRASRLDPSRLATVSESGCQRNADTLVRVERNRPCARNDRNASRSMAYLSEGSKSPIARSASSLMIEPGCGIRSGPQGSSHCAARPALDVPIVRPCGST